MSTRLSSSKSKVTCGPPRSISARKSSSCSFRSSPLSRIRVPRLTEKRSIRSVISDPASASEKCKAKANRSSPGISSLQADRLMNFQEFLSYEDMRQRSVDMNWHAPTPAPSRFIRGWRDARRLCDRGRYKRLGNVGLEAVLVDSEALDL